MYSLVIGALAIVSLGLLVLAMKVSENTQQVYKRDSAEYKAAVEERIRPVGQVILPGEEQLVAAPVIEVIEEPEPVATAMSGPQVYNSACLACHGAGVAGAPITGNQGQWTDRIAQGLDVLKDHAINGFSGAVGYMPAKGGRMDLSDDEVAAAVEYMVSESQ
jgi:cytochrome c5